MPMTTASKDSSKIKLYQTIASYSQAKWKEEGSFSGWQSGAVVWDNGDKVHLTLEQEGDILILSGIFAVPEDQGIGTHVLNAIKRHAKQEALLVSVVQVDNPEYFLYQGFTKEEDWDEELTGEYNPDMWWSPFSS